MRHSQVDKRATRTVPRQCVSDYGHNVHKDAPVRMPPVTLNFSSFGMEPLKVVLGRQKRLRQMELTPEY